MKNIAENIKKFKDRGRKVVGCFPLYPPLELFHALDLTPITLWGLRDFIPRVEHSDRHIQPYACSVARRLLEFVFAESGAALDGLFMYNACDTLRNLPEIIDCGLADVGRALPIFKMHLPMVPPAQPEWPAYLRERIERLIRDLEQAYRVTFSPEKFRQSVALHREMRELAKSLETRVAEGFLNYGEFSRITTEGWFTCVEDQILVLRKALRDEVGAENALARKSRRVVVSGILPPPRRMIRDLENAGVTVVGNDVASQNRALYYSPPLTDNPVDYYVDFYQRHYPCTTLLYTADRRVFAIRELVSGVQAQGVVFVGEKFCEYEYFEFPHLDRVLKNMGVRTLFLDVSIDDDEHAAAQATRIETFAELLDSAGAGGFHDQ
jgi:benzoyl-CoA reductase/2-hydroxyglutaryl-CoA dehydratase subunit BcrC/BadD/HgdB